MWSVIYPFFFVVATGWNCRCRSQGTAVEWLEDGARVGPSSAVRAICLNHSDWFSDWRLRHHRPVQYPYVWAIRLVFSLKSAAELMVINWFNWLLISDAVLIFCGALYVTFLADSLGHHRDFQILILVWTMAAFHWNQIQQFIRISFQFRCFCTRLPVSDRFNPMDFWLIVSFWIVIWACRLLFTEFSTSCKKKKERKKNGSEFR